MIDDSLNFVKAEILNINKSLELLGYLVNETEYVPWLTAIKHFLSILNIINESEIFGEFNNFLIRLVENIYKLLGWTEKPSDTWLDKLLRRNILAFACKIGNQDCINKSIEYYSNWIQNSSINLYNLLLFIPYSPILLSKMIFNRIIKLWQNINQFFFILPFFILKF